MTHVTCSRLTAKYRDQLRNPTLGNRVRATFFIFLLQQWSAIEENRSLRIITSSLHNCQLVATSNVASAMYTIINEMRRKSYKSPYTKFAARAGAICNRAAWMMRKYENIEATSTLRETNKTQVSTTNSWIIYTNWTFSTSSIGYNSTSSSVNYVQNICNRS